MEQKELHVQLIATNTPIVVLPASPTGWGDEADAVSVTGQIAMIRIRDKDDKPLFEIRIKTDGSVIITNRGFYTMHVPQTVFLNNERPWVEDRP